MANLIEGTRDQLAAIRADSSLTPAQEQEATRTLELGLAQKFVGLLTPAQKKELAALLLKRKQQNANSSSANSGGSASGPDIPSIDVPSSDDSGSSQDSSSSASNANTDSNSANSTAATATSSGTTSNAASAQPVSATVVAPSSAAAEANPGHLSDAQLAAILNSFVQDEGDESPAKPQAGDHSGS